MDEQSAAGRPARLTSGLLIAVVPAASKAAQPAGRTAAGTACACMQSAVIRPESHPFHPLTVIELLHVKAVKPKRNFHAAGPAGPATADEHVLHALQRSNSSNMQQYGLSLFLKSRSSSYKYIKPWPGAAEQSQAASKE